VPLRQSKPLWVSVSGARRQRKKLALSLHPIGRFGRPEEIADAVVWMCSDGASFMTGQSLVLDGGFLAGPNSPS
jgi:NAD(P)-dependent dehydrogenase (short-subunit alcohol dehydrogenase family)